MLQPQPERSSGRGSDRLVGDDSGEWDTAKQVVWRVVDELLSKLAEPMRQSVMGR